jgi:NADH dehydrogenase
LAAAKARVVIVGCGFGGLFAARALKRAPADVLVIDRNNYHLFQPLLYQVACAALAPADIAQPIRTILRYQQNARVMLAQIEHVDLAQRCVYAAGRRIPYDYLVLAPGAVDNYFGHQEWQQFAPGMKAVEEATYIRSRLLRSFETAELEADPAERAAQLTFIIIGAGPTGVELAGAIKDLAVDVIPRDYRVADTRHSRVILVEAGERVLPALHVDSSARALRRSPRCSAHRSGRAGACRWRPIARCRAIRKSSSSVMRPGCSMPRVGLQCRACPRARCRWAATSRA